MLTYRDFKYQRRIGLLYKLGACSLENNQKYMVFLLVGMMCVCVQFEDYIFFRYHKNSPK